MRLHAFEYSHSPAENAVYYDASGKPAENHGPLKRGWLEIDLDIEYDPEQTELVNEIISKLETLVNGQP